MRLTIGTPVFDDYSGLEMTLTSLLLHHDLTNVELIVVDNHPTRQEKDGKKVESENTRKTRQEAEAAGARYIAMPEPRGTAPPRNQIFDEATGDVVIVLDSHVLLAPTTLPAIRDYFAAQDHVGDILQGPLLSRRRGANGLQPMATHYADVWRSHMWGIWAQAWTCVCRQWHFDVGAKIPAEPSLAFGANGAIVATQQAQQSPMCTFHQVAMGGRASTVDACPYCGQPLPVDLPYAKHDKALDALGYRRRCHDAGDGEPFEIPGLGLGMFAARRDTWQRLGGFPADMIGFGGGELHLHELFRAGGGRAMCHPLAGWWHRFERDKVPYHADLWEKVRNYALWRRRLNMPVDDVHDHFTTTQYDSHGRELEKLNEAQWQHLLADPVAHREWPGHMADAPPVKPPKPKKGKRAQPPTEAADIERIYEWALTTKRDCISHLPTIRKLASQCGVVVSLVKRREWDVAVLAGKPAKYHSHNAEQDPLLDRLSGYTTRDVSDSLVAPPMDCDLLIIDTVHSAERLRAELDRWVPAVRRWIAIRGTKAFGEQAEKGNGPGLDLAIQELVDETSWRRVYYEPTQYGLTVLSCDPAERTIDRGVGYELAKLYKSLGINPPENCTCRALSAKMDALGPAGCRQHETELVTAMEANAEKYKWTDTLKAGFKAIGTGLAFKINPLDPLRSCLRMAVQRTEDGDRRWEASCHN
jgi:hypothetical protein